LKVSFKELISKTTGHV